MGIRLLHYECRGIGKRWAISALVLLGMAYACSAVAADRQQPGRRGRQQKKASLSVAIPNPHDMEPRFLITMSRDQRRIYLRAWDEPAATSGTQGSRAKPKSKARLKKKERIALQRQQAEEARERRQRADDREFIRNTGAAYGEEFRDADGQSYWVIDSSHSPAIQQSLNGKFGPYAINAGALEVVRRQEERFGVSEAQYRVPSEQTLAGMIRRDADMGRRITRYRHLLQDLDAQADGAYVILQPTAEQFQHLREVLTELEIALVIFGQETDIHEPILAFTAEEMMAWEGVPTMQAYFPLDLSIEAKRQSLFRFVNDLGNNALEFKPARTEGYLGQLSYGSERTTEDDTHVMGLTDDTLIRAHHLAIQSNFSVFVHNYKGDAVMIGQLHLDQEPSRRTLLYDRELVRALISGQLEELASQRQSEDKDLSAPNDDQRATTEDGNNGGNTIEANQLAEANQNCGQQRHEGEDDGVIDDDSADNTPADSADHEDDPERSLLSDAAAARFAEVNLATRFDYRPDSAGVLQFGRWLDQQIGIVSDLLANPDAAWTTEDLQYLQNRFGRWGALSDLIGIGRTWIATFDEMWPRIQAFIVQNPDEDLMQSMVTDLETLLALYSDEAAKYQRPGSLRSTKESEENQAGESGPSTAPNTDTATTGHLNQIERSVAPRLWFLDRDIRHRLTQLRHALGLDAKVSRHDAVTWIDALTQRAATALNWDMGTEEFNGLVATATDVLVAHQQAFSAPIDAARAVPDRSSPATRRALLWFQEMGTIFDDSGIPQEIAIFPTLTAAFEEAINAYLALREQQASTSDSDADPVTPRRVSFRQRRQTTTVRADDDETEGTPVAVMVVEAFAQDANPSDPAQEYRRLSHAAWRTWGYDADSGHVLEALATNPRAIAALGPWVRHRLAEAGRALLDVRYVFHDDVVLHLAQSVANAASDANASVATQILSPSDGESTSSPPTARSRQRQIEFSYVE